MLKPEDEKKETLGVQVIARAALIMRSLGKETASLGDLSKRTGLPKSTVQRIVDALATERLVDAGSDGVRLGWGLRELGDCVGSSVAEQLRDPLEALFAATHETVDISMLHGGEIIFLDRILSDQEVRVVPITDRPSPPYAMANGKAILACLGENDAERAWPDTPMALTAHTIRSFKALQQQIKNIRKTGFAYDREEHALGVCAIGTAVSVPGIYPHAISIALPAYRFEKSLPALRKALAACRSSCESILLHTP